MQRLRKLAPLAVAPLLLLGCEDQGPEGELGPPAEPDVGEGIEGGDVTDEDADAGDG